MIESRTKPAPVRRVASPRAVGPRSRSAPRSRGRPPRHSARDALARGRVGSLATTSLVLGILSVVFLGLLGPFAILKANEASAAARRLRMCTPATATAGLVLGWVATAFLILGLAYWVFFLGLFAAAA